MVLTGGLSTLLKNSESLFLSQLDEWHCNFQWNYLIQTSLCILEKIRNVFVFNQGWINDDKYKERGILQKMLDFIDSVMSWWILFFT